MRRLSKDRGNPHFEMNRELIKTAKSVQCADCGHPFPSYVLEFDHREPASKSFNISQQWRYVSHERLRRELAKCDVVCANCHRERTHGIPVHKRLAPDVLSVAA